MKKYPPLLWSGGILSVSWRDMNMTEQGHWTKHWLGLLMQRGWNHGITTLNVTKHLNISKYYLNSVLAASWHKLTFARPELGCHAEVGGQLPAAGRRGTSGDIITFNRPLQDAIIYRIWLLDWDTVHSLPPSTTILHNIKEPQKCMPVNSLRSKFPIPLWEFSFVFAKLSFLIYFQEGGWWGP